MPIMGSNRQETLAVRLRFSADLQHQLPVASPYEQEQDAIALGDCPQLAQILN